MLTITRHKNEAFLLKFPGLSDVRIRIHSIRGGSRPRQPNVKVSIEAPASVAIVREELVASSPKAPLLALKAEDVAHVRAAADSMVATDVYRRSVIEQALKTRHCESLSMATRALLEETDDLPLDADALRGFVDRFARRNPHLFATRGAA